MCNYWTAVVCLCWRPFGISHAPPSVLFCTTVASDAVLHSLSDPCVVGFVWKHPSVRAELPAALDRIRAHGTYVPADLKAALSAFRSSPKAFNKLLSKRETELLPLLGRGLSDDEVGRLAGALPATVKSHRSHILRKLGLPNTQKLMSWALDHGFIYPVYA